jgi:hypothetical protein
MARFKSPLVTLIAFVALLAVVPGVVMAAHSDAKTAPPTGHVFGRLESITATNAIISTKVGDIKVLLEPIVAYVSYDQAAALAGLKAGDQVDASGTYGDGTLHVDRMRYDTVAFPISGLIRFDGRYSASTATTLTLTLKRKAMITFNLDANTRYFENGHRLAGPPPFIRGERVVVWAREFSDQSWLAAIVNDIDPR